MIKMNTASAKMARCLSHIDRSKIVRYILDHQTGCLDLGISVSEIQRGTGLDQPAVSAGLRLLKVAGVVDCTPVKSFRYYRVKHTAQVEAFLASVENLTAPDYEKG